MHTNSAAGRRFSIYIKCLWASFCCFSRREKKTSEHIDSLGDVTVRNMKNSKSQLQRSLTSAAMLMLWFITSTNISSQSYGQVKQTSIHLTILQINWFSLFSPRQSSAPELVEIKINWWNSSNYIVLSHEHELQLIVEFLTFYHRRNEMEILGWVEDWCIESIISLTWNREWSNGKQQQQQT